MSEQKIIVDLRKVMLCNSTADFKPRRDHKKISENNMIFCKNCGMNSAEIDEQYRDIVYIRQNIKSLSRMIKTGINENQQWTYSNLKIEFVE